MRPVEFTHPITVRYLEVDGQGVVFNMWYLAYFDDALTGYLEARGLPYPVMTGAGYDVQLVRTEIDYRAGLRWRDDARVAVSTAAIGRTSFTLDFAVQRTSEGEVQTVVTGRTVYVVIATDGSGKQPVPALLLDALGEPRSQPLAERPRRAAERNTGAARGLS